MFWSSLASVLDDAFLILVCNLACGGGSFDGTRPRGER